MKAKKSFKADLRNKRSLFLEIGLVVALSLVIIAFSHTPKEYRIKSVAVTYEPGAEELPPVNTEFPKPEQKKVQVAQVSDILQIIRNDHQMQTDLTFDEIDPNTLIDILPVAKGEDIIDDTIFLRAETMPSFQNGDLNTFRTWVVQNVKFPQALIETGIGGRVILSFVIDKDGRLTNIEVLQSPDRLLSEEAIRVLNNSPKWKPGKQRDQTVRVRYTLPVDFRIQQ